MPTIISSELEVHPKGCKTGQLARCDRSRGLITGAFKVQLIFRCRTVWLHFLKHRCEQRSAKPTAVHFGIIYDFSRNAAATGYVMQARSSRARPFLWGARALKFVGLAFSESPEAYFNLPPIRKIMMIENKICSSNFWIPG